MMEAGPAITIWCALFFTFILIVLSTYISWRLYYESVVLEGRSKGRIIVPIAATLFCVFSLITPCVRYDQINLVELIFEEVAKVIMAMPKLLIFIGTVTIVQFAVLILFILAAIQLMTTTELKIITWDYYEFNELSNFARFSLICIAFVANWTMQIFVGFQWMTVAGTVASWYFEEDAQRNASIFKSVLRSWYHVGTIAYGSLFQPWVLILNHGLKLFTFSCGYGVCLFERIKKVQIYFETYSKNAFIEAALHGQSFSRSGKRAYNVLLTTAPGVIAINNLGNALVFTSQVNVIVISIAISYALFLNSNNIWLPTAVSCIANTILISALFGTFQITMHTLSICFCEDKVINDGNLRPFHTSKELKEFVEKADELFVKSQSSDEGNHCV